MNVIQKTLRWGLQKAAGYAGVSVTLKDAALGRWFGGTTYTGKAINDETAMQISVVWSCVRILAETFGALPWGVYRRDSRGNAEQVDHALAQVLITSPNADMTSVEYRESSMVNMGLRGNCYALKNFNGAGNISSLYPVPAAHVEPKREPDGTITYRVLDRGQWETYPQDKIWHVKGFGSNGLVGYSPIGYVRQAMGLALATEEFGARFFGQGARSSGVVKIPAWLNDDQRKIARENLSKAYEGLENSHKLWLLEGGMEYSSVSMPMDDAQFLETRRFQLQEICRIFRVPPHMVADLERATFSNVEHLSQDFVTYTLLPYLTRFEQSASKWLFKPGERGQYFIRFNVEGLLRADTAARGAFYAQMLQNGVYSRNEVRAKENMNRVDGLDDYTVQSNMTLVQLVEQMQRAAAGNAAAN